MRSVQDCTVKLTRRRNDAVIFSAGLCCFHEDRDGENWRECNASHALMMADADRQRYGFTIYIPLDSFTYNFPPSYLLSSLKTHLVQMRKTFPTAFLQTAIERLSL